MERFRKPNFIAGIFFLVQNHQTFPVISFSAQNFSTLTSQDISDLLSTQTHTLMTKERSIVSTELKISSFSTDASSELKAGSIQKCCYGCRCHSTVPFFFLLDGAFKNIHISVGNRHKSFSMSFVFLLRCMRNTFMDTWIQNNS